MAIRLITDSSCDLPLSYFEQNADILTLVGMPIGIGDDAYIDDLGKTLKHDLFYQKLSEGVFPTTSQINSTVFTEQYAKSYEKGEAVVYVGLSIGLSGTMNNAVLAKNMFLEEHPDADISVIDTLSASGGLGALVAEGVNRIREGKTRDEVVSYLKESAIKSNHWFAIDDLEHLRRGGRIPAAIAIVGGALKVKPILTIAHDGKIKSYASVRGRSKSIKYLFQKFEEHIGNVEDKVVCICHGNCIEDALELRQMVLQSYQPKEIIIAMLSATIATHVGPGMLAIAFVADDIREDK